MLECHPPFWSPSRTGSTSSLLGWMIWQVLEVSIYLFT